MVVPARPNVGDTPFPPPTWQPQQAGVATPVSGQELRCHWLVVQLYQKRERRKTARWKPPTLATLHSCSSGFKRTVDHHNNHSGCSPEYMKHEVDTCCWSASRWIAALSTSASQDQHTCNPLESSHCNSASGSPIGEPFNRTLLASNLFHCLSTARQPWRTKAISPSTPAGSDGIHSVAQSSRRNSVELRENHQVTTSLVRNRLDNLSEPRPSPQKPTQKGATTAWPSEPSEGEQLTWPQQQNDPPGHVHSNSGATASCGASSPGHAQK